MAEKTTDEILLEIKVSYEVAFKLQSGNRRFETGSKRPEKTVRRRKNNTKAV